MNALIDSVAVFGYTMNYRHGEYVMSGGRAARAETGTVVRVAADDGTVGWGEITPLGTTYLPTFTGSVRAALEELAPALLGVDPGNISAVNRAMEAALMGHSYAKSALDIACWDLKAQAASVPVAALLGGVLQQRYPIYEPVPLRSPEEMADYIAQRRAAGVNRFQLKVGNDPLEDCARVRSAVGAAAPDTIIVADANGGWNTRDARIAVRELEGLPIYLEQPCRTTDDCISVTARSDLSLVLDESIVTVGDVIQAKYEARAVSINVKLSRVGGITKAVQIRNLMQDLDMMVSVEDMWGGDIITAAISHVAASTAPESLMMTPFMNDLTDGHLAGYQPRSADGYGSAPTRPGLGIDVDETLLGAPLFTTHR